MSGRRIRASRASKHFRVRTCHSGVRVCVKFSVRRTGKSRVHRSRASATATGAGGLDSSDDEVDPDLLTTSAPTRFSLTVSQLKQMCVEARIEFQDAATKAELRKLLSLPPIPARAKRTAPSAPAPAPPVPSSAHPMPKRAAPVRKRRIVVSESESDDDSSSSK